MAGAISTTPQELVVEKLLHTYDFPSYVSSGEVFYKTRRFLVFKPDKSLRVLAAKEPGGYVNLNEWSFILVDGKDSLPKGKLRYNDDGGVSGALLGWSREHAGRTVRESARQLITYINKGWW